MLSAPDLPARSRDRQLLEISSMPSLRPILLVTVAASFAVASTGCAGMSKRDQGAIIGATAGGAIGGVVAGNTVKGVIIGAAVGGAAGAIIGHQMDQQAKKLEQNIPGATVQRAGEGIAVTFESGLLYDFNSAVVKPTAATNLTNLANSLKEYPNTDVVIVGHTDSVGTYDYNQQLSERRARAAADYLISRGVAASRIRASGLGETEPIASNSTEEGRAKNRRVEVAIVANAALKEEAKRQAGN
jgi:outer membrane protein OmpA-like peptidoglycan-associated protein